MENDSVIKTRLQLIPGITLLIFFALIVTFKFIGYPEIASIGLLINLLTWLLAIFGAIFACISLITYIFKIIKKSNDYTILKKTSLIALEFIILFSLLLFTKDLLRPLSYPTRTQTEAYVKKLNTLIVGKNVAPEEVNAIKLLFKDESPSKAYTNLQKGTFQKPQGSRSERQNNLLKIEKLDKDCNFMNTKNTAYFKNCVDGDLYVRYGWDMCFPGQLDCIGDNYFEDYQLRTIDGKLEIIKVF
jgi:hypothetical protein